MPALAPAGASRAQPAARKAAPAPQRPQAGRAAGRQADAGYALKAAPPNLARRGRSRQGRREAAKSRCQQVARQGGKAMTQGQGAKDRRPRRGPGQGSQSRRQRLPAKQAGQAGRSKTQVKSLDAAKAPPRRREETARPERLTEGGGDRKYRAPSHRILATTPGPGFGEASCLRVCALDRLRPTLACGRSRGHVTCSETEPCTMRRRQAGERSDGLGPYRWSEHSDQQAGADRAPIYPRHRAHQGARDRGQGGDSGRAPGGAAHRPGGACRSAK